MPHGPASHVVVGPDKFKGTLTATQVAAHVAAGPDLPVVAVTGVCSPSPAQLRAAGGSGPESTHPRRRKVDR